MGPPYNFFPLSQVVLFLQNVWSGNFTKWTFITFTCAHIKIDHIPQTIWLSVSNDLGNLELTKDEFSSWNHFDLMFCQDTNSFCPICKKAAIIAILKFLLMLLINHSGYSHGATLSFFTQFESYISWNLWPYFNMADMAAILECLLPLFFQNVCTYINKVHNPHLFIVTITSFSESMVLDIGVWIQNVLRHC